MLDTRVNFKTSLFAQYLRQAQILILEILNVWMPVPLYLSGVVNPATAGSPSLILNPTLSGKHFETASTKLYGYDNEF